MYLQILTTFLQPDLPQNLAWRPMELHRDSLHMGDIIIPVLRVLMRERMDRTRFRVNRELILHLMMSDHGTSRIFIALEDLVLLILMMNDHGTSQILIALEDLVLLMLMMSDHGTGRIIIGVEDLVLLMRMPMSPYQMLLQLSLCPRTTGIAGVTDLTGNKLLQRRKRTLI